MHRIFYALLFFSSLATAPFSLMATPETSHSTENSQNIQTVPAPSSSADDHGFMFPLEDLVDAPDKHNDRFYSEFLNMLATLGLVIAIILMAAWVLRRLLNTRLEQINTTSIIKIVERRALSPKSAVYLLEIYDKIVVIAETQNGITQLGEFAIPPEPITHQDNPPPFNTFLEKK